MEDSNHHRARHWVSVAITLLAAALAAWAVLVVLEAILLFGVLRLFAIFIGPDLLPSLKVVFDMAALAASGWVAGRLANPRVKAAAAMTAAGLALFDFTPYLALNVPWMLSLVTYAFDESRYMTSLLTMLTMHALLFGSLFAGALLSRPRLKPLGLGI